MAKAYSPRSSTRPWTRSGRSARDFNGLGTWNAEMVPTCEIEDGKAGDQVGAVRSFTLANGAHLREKLLAHSDRDRSYYVQLPEASVRGRRELRLHDPLPPGHGHEPDLRASGRTTFDCAPDKLDHWEDFFATEVFKGAARGAEGVRREVSARQEYRVEGLPEPFSHYTDAVRAGDLLFVSGLRGARRGGQARRRRRRGRAGAAGVREHRARAWPLRARRSRTWSR